MDVLEKGGDPLKINAEGVSTHDKMVRMENNTAKLPKEEKNLVELSFKPMWDTFF